MSRKFSSKQLVVVTVSFIVLMVGYLPLHAFAAFLVPAAQEFGVGSQAGHSRGLL